MSHKIERANPLNVQSKTKSQKIADRITVVITGRVAGWAVIGELPNIFKTVRLINQARIFKLVFLGLFSQAVITNFCCLFGHNYQFKA